MKSYRSVLEEADQHFARVFAEQKEQMQCGRGCSFCCYGLFEVSSSDVAVLVDALRSLPEETRQDIIRSAEEIISSHNHPNIREIEEKEKDAFFDRTSSVACPALGAGGECRIYEHRPLVCRTFGLPLRNGEQYIGDICDLNFNDASSEVVEAAAWDLLNEDAVDPGQQYTVPEAIMIAQRMALQKKR